MARLLRALTMAIGKYPSSAIGTRIGATVNSTPTTPTVMTSVEMIVTIPNTTAADWPPAASAGPLEAVVEIRPLEHLEVALGGDIEDLVRRPALHLLTQREAQLARDSLTERRQHQQPAEHGEVRRQRARH